jgi:hypothetical protein
MVISPEIRPSAEIRRRPVAPAVASPIAIVSRST